MDYEVSVDLQGTEFVTTFFSDIEKSIMILATGENMSGNKPGPIFIFLYMCIDGEVEHGINTFVFMKPEDAYKFIEDLPKMSAIDFMVKGTSIPPTICE